jgi:hypothetical protein
MEWPIVLVLVLAIPVLLIPAAYIWYLNIGGIYAFLREARARRLHNEKLAASVSHAESKH